MASIKCEDDELLGETVVSVSLCQSEDEEIDEDKLLRLDEGEEIELNILADDDAVLEGLELDGTESNAFIGAYETEETPEHAAPDEDATDQSVECEELQNDSVTEPPQLVEQDSSSESEDEDGHGRSRFKAERDISSVSIRRNQSEIPDKLEVRTEDQRTADKFKRPQPPNRGGHRGGRGRGNSGHNRGGGRFTRPSMQNQCNNRQYRPSYMMQGGLNQPPRPLLGNNIIPQQNIPQPLITPQFNMGARFPSPHQNRPHIQMHNQPNFEQQQQMNFMQQQLPQFVGSPIHQGQSFPPRPRGDLMNSPPFDSAMMNQPPQHPTELPLRQQLPQHQPHHPNRMHQPYSGGKPKRHILDELIDIGAKGPTSNKILVNPRFMAQNRMPLSQPNSGMMQSGQQRFTSPQHNNSPIQPQLGMLPSRSEGIPSLFDGQPRQQFQGGHTGPRNNQMAPPVPRNPAPRHQPRPLNPVNQSRNEASSTIPQKEPSKTSSKQLTAAEREHFKKLEERGKRFSQKTEGTVDKKTQIRLGVKRASNDNTSDTASPPKSVKQTSTASGNKVTAQTSVVKKSVASSVKEDVVKSAPSAAAKPAAGSVTAAGDAQLDEEKMYKNKLLEQKRMREEILKRKEMNRKIKMNASKSNEPVKKPTEPVPEKTIPVAVKKPPAMQKTVEHKPNFVNPGVMRGQPAKHIGNQGGMVRPALRQGSDQMKLGGMRGARVGRGRGRGSIRGHGGSSGALREVTLMDDERSVFLRTQHLDYADQQEPYHQSQQRFQPSTISPRVCVSNLADSTTCQKLQQLAQSCGNVQAVSVVEDGSVIIDFSNTGEAIAFVKRYNRAMVDMRYIETVMV